MPTNDFRWKNHANQAIELKTCRATKYTSIQKRMNETVEKAERRQVVKANFIIDLQDHALMPKLRAQLESYNLRNDRRVRRMWVMTRGRLVSIALR